MGFMTVAADAVSGGSGGEFLHVTTLALGRHTAPVGLVTALARLVATPDLAALVRMAGRAARREHGRLMGESAVATLTSGMAGAERSQLQFFLMAAFAHIVLREVDLEVVRQVTLLASDSGVERVVSRSDPMTAATTERDDLLLPMIRVRIVASQTRCALAALRVVGVNVPMAIVADPRGSAPNVVRRVAVRAHGMRRYRSLGQYHDVGMARAAGHGALRLERVWLMTIHARCVTTGKERRGWHDRLLLTVTLAAGGQRGGGRRVLMAVTGGAHAITGLTRRSVRRFDFAVTAVTLCRDGCSILMRSVAVHALRRSVHGHRGDLSLRLQVATPAVFRTEDFAHTAIGRFVSGAVALESMAARAIGAHPRTEALLGLMRGVFDAGFWRVTARATTRRNRADASGSQFVAAVALEMLLDNVDAMARHTPIRLPIHLHVNPSTRRAPGPVLRAARGTGRETREHEHQHGEGEGCGGP